MHLYASPHKLHSVDTLHSDALAFLRINAHSNAFIHTRIRLHSHVYALGDGEESDEDLDVDMCSGTWVLHGHALWHAHSPSSPYPLRPHVSLALSPLGFSCVSMCGSTVRCIPTHSVTHACAFLCILTHMTRV